MSRKCEFSYPGYGKDHFRNEFAQHELKVRHDDGLYRHLVCVRPNTYLNSFTIITWPGYLTISGDCEGFVFARIPDMFEFFRPNSGWNSYNINPDYWAEKVQDGRERAKEYDSSLAAACVWGEVREAYREYGKEARGLARAIKTYLIDDCTFDFEDSFREAAYRFEFLIGGSTPFRFETTCDWKVRNWTHTFLWCCHAIQFAIRKYDELKTTVAAPEYPAVGSTILDQPGYVVGTCGHRVAKSEWTAGFRTCERCPTRKESPYRAGPRDNLHSSPSDNQDQA